MSSETSKAAAPPLASLRVLDLSWVMVGPMSARYLADLGADVIKVESSKRVDPLRTLGPFVDAIPHPERTLSYHFINAGKRSITLDLNSEDGREIVRKLVRHIDVVIESFTSGVLDRMGLGWKDLSSENPSLIMASTCLFGQTGPERAASGVGTLGAAYSGAYHLVGWPDRTPTGPFNAWTDSVTPRFVVASILAALRRRNVDGRGCYVDVSQAEAGLQFLLPAYFDCAANGVVPGRQGDDADLLRAPSGVFPCAGVERWVYIDASADTHWRALRTIAAPLLDDAEFDTLVQRLRNKSALHAQLASWTRIRGADDIEVSLQAEGVPAHIVCDCDDLISDSDLASDNYYGAIEDPMIGRTLMRQAQCSIRPASTVPVRAAPRIGGSTDEVLRELGGFSDDAIAEFRRRGALA